MVISDKGATASPANDQNRNLVLDNTPTKASWASLSRRDRDISFTDKGRGSQIPNLDSHAQIKELRNELKTRSNDLHSAEEMCKKLSNEKQLLEQKVSFLKEEEKCTE